MSHTDYLEINRRAWNWKTGLHCKSRFYDVDGFLAGRGSLNEIETNILGDVHGKSILHLQCHFGQDSLSLARHGAKVVGVDLSDAAIEKAKELNRTLSLDAEFICCDIYDLPNRLDTKFDIIFTSYGILGWLPDLNRWAGVVSHFMKPNGLFVLVEFHPVAWMFDPDFKKIDYPYSSQEPIVEETGTYTDAQEDTVMPTVTWNHGIGKVVTALAKQRIIVEELAEYDYSPYDIFHGAVESEPGRFRLFDGKIPLVYSLVGRPERL